MKVLILAAFFEIFLMAGISFLLTALGVKILCFGLSLIGISFAFTWIKALGIWLAVIALKKLIF